MKILVIGGTGLIGSEVVRQLKALNHEVFTASVSKGDFKVDLADSHSIKALFDSCQNLDAVICTAGAVKQKQTIQNQTIEDYQHAIQEKGFGQINLVLTGQHFLNPQGCFILTTGILSQGIIAKTSATAMVNNAVEGFAKAAALELKNGQRLNVISPSVITEALPRYGDTFAGYEGVSVKQAASAYVRALYGRMNGQVITVW